MVHFFADSAKIYGSKNDVTVGNAHAQGAGDRDGYFQRIVLASPCNADNNSIETRPSPSSVRNCVRRQLNV